MSASPTHPTPIHPSALIHPSRVHTLVVLGGLLTLASLWPPPANAIQPVVVNTYPQEMGSQYPGMAENAADVQAVAVVTGDHVYAGTAAGLYRLDGQAWVPVPKFVGKAISLVAGNEKQTLLVVCDGKLLALSGEVLAPLPGKGPYDSLRANAGRIVLTGQEGLFLLQGDHFAADTDLQRATGADHRVFQWAASVDGTEIAAAQTGLFRRKAGAPWEMLFPKQGTRRWAPEHVTAAGFDQAGRLWFAAPQGVGCLESGAWRLYAGGDGLPYNGFTSMAFDPGGHVWFGTDRGAVAFDGKHWAYREGKRWLPDNSVRQIAVTREGTVIAATPHGVGVIERKPIRFAEKVRFFEDEIDKRHRRTPWEYVLSVSLKRSGDTSQWTQHDSDNDGQWTGMYGAAECFAYAATKDPKAKQRATKAFEALRFLGQVTQGGTHPAPKGFPARCILPTSGPDPNTWQCYSIEADRQEQSRDSLWKVAAIRAGPTGATESGIGSATPARTSSMGIIISMPATTTSWPKRRRKRSASAKSCAS